MVVPTNERLVAVETKLDAVLLSVEHLSAKFDKIQGNYVSRTEYEKELERVREEIEAAKRKTSLQTWVTGTLSAILGAVFAILLQAYFGG